MQNATPSQFKMLMTRIGNGSKMIVTGDLEQHDRGFEQNGTNTRKNKHSFRELSL